jgi:hypothetical protein
VVNRVRYILCDGFVKREVGEKTVIIRDGHIIKIEQNIKLKAIAKPRNKASTVEDNNVGVIDTETYRDADGNIRIYALGFNSILNKEPVMYYIDKGFG